MLERMNNINSDCIQNLAVCELNTKFNDKCHVDWSKTNHISIVSLDGIYVLEPQKEQNCPGPFSMELIRSPNKRFKHKNFSKFHPTFDNMWQSLSRSQYMDVFLDPALMTNIETLSLEDYPRKFKLAKWSLSLEAEIKECLLATITMDYQLQIFSRRYNLWIELLNLSEAYDDLWTHMQANSDLKENADFETILKSLHSLSFCNLCWKETNTDAFILLTATITGDIIVWQLNISSSSCGDHRKNSNYDVKVILQTGLEYISTMQLYDNLLIVAVRDGQVVLYDLTDNLNEFDESNSIIARQPANSASVKTVNLVSLPPTATLWHKDNIEVTDFYVQPISGDTFRIVLAKSTNICWCIINFKKRTDKEPAALAISDSFSAIDGLHPDVSLHQTPATWLRPAGDKRAVLIAEDGSFFLLEFVDDRQDTSPKFSAVRTGPVDLSRMVPRGLCTSPDGRLIIMISSISLMYEPAKIHAPTKVLLLPIENSELQHDNTGDQ